MNSAHGFTEGSDMTDNSERKAGWYWVKYGVLEQCAYFVDGEWFLIGLEDHIKDNSPYLEIIDPRPITRSQVDELEVLRELNGLKDIRFGVIHRNDIEERIIKLEEKLKSITK